MDEREAPGGAVSEAATQNEPEPRLAASLLGLLKRPPCHKPGSEENVSEVLSVASYFTRTDEMRLAQPI